MSGFANPDLDGDDGCCGCLRFLMRPDEDADFEKACLLDRHLGGSHRKLAPLMPGKNRAICREQPVKETTRLTLGRDASGQKTINEYVREYTIGRGSYGKVVLYRSSIDGKQYAIKAFYKSRLSRLQVTSVETAMTDVLREISIMKTIEHPNIINLIEVIDDPDSDNLYIVLEYVEGKSICASSGTFGGIGEIASRRYLRDIIAGLMYLHAHDIVHGDIKPDNLLVTREGAVKIGDFSVSHAFEDGNDELCRSPGTPVFTAPECCLGSSYHGKVADIWAVGVTLYCMILGRCPFVGDSFKDTYDKIVDNPLNLPNEFEPELKNLLQGLLCKGLANVEMTEKLLVDPFACEKQVFDYAVDYPARRMTLAAVADHPWVIRVCGPIPETSCRCKSGSCQMKNQLFSKSDANGT